MKAIELTEEHKSKLLEMCTLLFPEYIFGFDNDIADVGIMECHQGDWNNVIFFHWFEFCMTYLSERLYNEHYSLEVCEDIRNEQLYDCFINNHPIDYLYDEFKTLKLKN